MTSSEQFSVLVEDLANAGRVGDHQAFFAAGQRIADQMDDASQDELSRATAELAPVLSEAPISLGGALAQYLGSLVGMEGDVSAVVDPLAKGACAALEGAVQFEALYEEMIGTVPVRDKCGRLEFEQFVAATGTRIEDPAAVARRWMSAEAWVQPVLLLSQREDFRSAIPDRQRLISAATAAEDVLPDLAPWLEGLLRIVDQENLVVVHREAGLACRATIVGVADNSQLHTLLAAQVFPHLPTERRGLLRRWSQRHMGPTAPSPAMVAAADGSGPLDPPGGIMGQFNLVDGNGAWIWNEGRPDEIPMIDGARLVVLDPPPYVRGWNSGRAYPLLRASVEVSPLPEHEAQRWLSRISSADTADVATQAAGAPTWTADLSVRLPEGRTVAELVSFVLAVRQRGTDGDELHTDVAREFDLSPEDAALSVDRVFGGVTRARTDNPANRPDPVDDPIAFESYRRTISET